MIEHRTQAGGLARAARGFRVARTAAAVVLAVAATAAHADQATGTVTVSGYPYVGNTVTAEVTGLADDDGLPAESARTWSWLRVDGSSEQVIAGATDASYTLTAAEDGKKVKARYQFTDNAGNAETLTSAAFPETGNIATDDTPPAPVSAETSTSGLVLTVTMSEVLDAEHSPPARRFRIAPAGDAIDVSSATVGTGTTVVTLNLSRALRAGEAASVSYTDRTPNDDEVALQDLAGNDAASFEVAVTNMSTVAATVPGKPRGLDAVGVSGSRIDLAWTAPEDSGGRAISGYQVRGFTRPNGFWAELATVAGTTYTYSETGLSPGAKRRYAVIAINSVGSGPWSDTADATTRAADEAAGTVTITGEPVVGEVLAAWVSDLSDSDGIPDAPVLSYQWVRVGDRDTDIADATYQGYRLTSADSGKRVRVKVSFRDNAGNTETLTSVAFPVNGTVAACDPYALRLRRGTSREGSLEMCLGGAFKAVCDDGWDDAGAGVACRQLGFDDGTATDESAFGLISPANFGTRRISCSGAEAALELCDLELQTTQIACHFSERAGVRCTGTGPTAPFQTTATTTILILPENSPAGTAVGAPVTVEHPDGTAMAYALVGADAASFAIDAATGQISTIAGVTYDFEIKSEYTFTVVATGGGRFASVPVRVELEDATDEPGAPTDLEAVAAGGSRIVLGWGAAEDASGLTVRYEVEWSADGSTGWTVLVADTAATTYAHTGLEPETTRHYRVSAFTALGRGPASETARATTGEAGDAAGTVTITGKPFVGEVVAAWVSDLSDPDGIPAVPVLTYQWVRIGVEVTGPFGPGLTDVEIDGATSQTYILAAADQGKQVRVKVSFEDSAGNAETLVGPAFPKPGTVAGRPRACTAGSIRLVEGDTRFEGHIQHCDNGSFGASDADTAQCDDGWNDAGARVACRQLGFAGGTATDESAFGLISPVSFYIRRLACDGDEATLLDCTHELQTTQTPCHFSERAGVRCTAGTGTGTGTALTRSLPENSLPGTAVGAPVTVEHPDGPATAYALAGTDAASFGIDAATGQIRAIAGVTYDYETKTEYAVIVVATDGSWIASIPVTIKIEDGVPVSIRAVRDRVLMTDGSVRFRLSSTATPERDLAVHVDATQSYPWFAETSQIGRYSASDDVWSDVIFTFDDGGRNSPAITGELTATLAQGGGYEGGEQTSATVVIFADDPLITVRLVPASLTIYEDADRVPLEVRVATVLAAPKPQRDLVLRVKTVPDTATAADYGGGVADLRFEPEDFEEADHTRDDFRWAASRTVFMDPVDDSEKEDRERLFIQLERLDETPRLARFVWADGTPCDEAPGTACGTEVVIVDDDNSAPAFASASYRLQVNENVDPGTAVGEPLVATDPEGDPLEYSLSGADADSFVADGPQIRTRRGVVYDYEGKRTFHLVMNADDGNRRASAAVTVDLRNESAEGPQPTGATVSGAALEMVFGTEMSRSPAPQATWFSVTVDGVSTAVDGVTVDGTTVRLTLADAVEHGQGVRVAHHPSADEGLRDRNGNRAPAFDVGVRNRTPDPGPQLVRAWVDERAFLRLKYDRKIDHDVPPRSAFRVTADGASVALAGPTEDDIDPAVANCVDGICVSTPIVRLKLASTVAAGQTVTLDYDRPTVAEINRGQFNYIHASGNYASSLSGQAVENEVGVALGEVRLVGGPDASEGRLEVFVEYRNHNLHERYPAGWGTVCDDRFTDAHAETGETNDAAGVACRQLGFSRGRYVPDYGGTTTDFETPILLDDVRCYTGSGSRTGSPAETLLDCWYAGPGLHNCDHSEDVGLKCTNDSGQRADVRVGDTSADEGPPAQDGDPPGGSGAAPRGLAAKRSAPGGGKAAAAPAPGASDATPADEGTTPAMRFTVRLSEVAPRRVEVDYATEDGTATAGADYEAAEGTLTFALGETVRTVDVALLDDAFDENDETLKLTLRAVRGAEFGDGEAVGTIEDDDGGQDGPGDGARQLSVSDASAAEGGSASFLVRLDRSAEDAVTVDYATEDGTATAGSDYTAASGTLTFPAGETANTVAVALLDDAAREADETFTLRLSNASGAVLADAAATGTIKDATPTPPATATFVSVPVGHDGTGFSATFEFSRDVGATSAWVRGTLVAATNGRVAQARPAAESSSLGWTVDVEPSGAGTDVGLSIASGAALPDGGTLGTGDSATVPGQSLSVADAAAAEGGTASFAVTLDRGATGTATVDYATEDGTATAESDYKAASGTLTFAAGESSKTVDVALLDDDAVEEEETFALRLSNASAAGLADAAATGTIEDATPTAKFLSVPAGHDGTEFSATFEFSQDVGAGYEWVRETLVTATNGEVEQARRKDPPSNLGWEVDVAPSDAGADITLAIVSGVAPPNGRTLGRGDSATVPGQSLSVANASAAEGGTASFAVTLDRGATGTVTVDYATADGTARAESDYTAASGTLTFAAGESSRTVVVALAEDEAQEEDETFTLRLSNPSGAALAEAVATGTINDTTPRGLSASFVDWPAEHAGGEFKAQFEFSEDVGVGYAWVADTLVTATNGEVEQARRRDPPSNVGWEVDVAPSGLAWDVTLSIAAGTSLPDGRTLETGDSVTVPGRGLSVADASGTEGGTADFEVTLSRASTATATVDYATSDGTATAASDYTAASGTLSFAAGETSKKVAVPLTDDAVYEDEETFTLTLSNASGAGLAGATATGTIEDDDEAEVTAEFVSTPSRHLGDLFRVTFEFSEDIGDASAAWVRDTLVTATGGSVHDARRTGSTNVAWQVDARPSSADQDVTLSIAAGARLPDGRTLAAGDSVTVPALKLTVSDVRAKEGGTATFTATLSVPAGFSLNLAYATADGTATAGSDYTAASGRLWFGRNQTSKTVSVTLLDDTRGEHEETFSLTVSNPDNDGGLAGATGTGKIEDDDGLAATFESVPAEHDGATAFEALVKFNEDVGMGWAWVRDTLVTASNATVNNASRVNPPSNEEWELEIEPASSADVVLSIASGTQLPDGRTLATGDSVTVIGLKLTVSDARAPEGGTATFTATLSAPPGASMDLAYATADGTATAGSDYTAASGTLTFGSDETSKTVSVTLLDDTRGEHDETFSLTVSNPDDDGTLTAATATGTIEDDDGPAATLESVPEEHDGATAFGARVKFNEEIGLDWVWVRDTLVTASNATVEKASRADPPRNVEWDLEIEPASAADVVLTLTEGLSLPDGRTLDVGDPATVRGPAPTGAQVAGRTLTLVWPTARDAFGAASGSDYAVAVNGVPRAVASAKIAGRAAVLVLSSPVAPGDAVAAGYVGSAMHPLADAAGRVRSAPWDGVAVDNVTGKEPAEPGPGAAGRRAVDPLAAAPDGAVRLDASGAGLAVLPPLGRLAALERLDLSDNELADVGPLAELGTLRELDLSGNRIAALWPLRALHGLERLDLSGNRVSDVAALAELASLRVLLLDGNAVADLGPLSYLTALEHLGLAGNRVADVAALQDLPRLRRLDLGGNPVADLSPLGDIGSLVWLALPGDPAAAADALARLTGLRWVWPGAEPAPRDGPADAER